MENSLNWLWGLILVPVIAGIFRSELGEAFETYRIYKCGMMDSDGNPKTMEKIWIHYYGTDIWELITVVHYQWGIMRHQRFVRIMDSDGDCENISLLSWSSMRKKPYKKDFTKFKIDDIIFSDSPYDR